MTEPVRWGVLGVAGINAAMVPAIISSPHAQLVGIASRDVSRARASADEHGVEAFDGYDALLADPRIEAVYIPTPNAQHAEWTIKAARAGKHILCEKPLAVTAVEAREMAAAAEDAGVVLAEAFMYVHHPRYERIREIISSGGIGEIRQVHVTFTFDASDELDHSGFRGAPGSGAIYDVGCYAVHVARTLLGAEPEALTAHAATSQLHGGIDMSTSLLLEFPGGVGVTAQVGMWNEDQDTVSVVGSRGRIDVPHAFISPPDGAEALVTRGDDIDVISSPRVDHYERQVTRFSEAVRGSGDLLFAIDDAIAQARILEAATRSWQQRERIAIV